MEISKPIFIVGVPRSGTTLLYDLVSSHKDLAWFSQSDLRELLSQEFLEFQYLRRRIFEIRRWPFLRDGFEVRFTTSFEMPHEYGLFWNKWISKSWARDYDVIDYSLKGLREGVNNLLKKKGKKRFLSKDPSHSIRIEFLNKVFPGAIFINLVRDGRAVVNSMSLAGRKFNNPDYYFGLDLKNNNQMDFDLLERHAIQWIEINEEIQQAFEFGLDKNQHCDIKYEDLVSQPKKTLDKIFKFCELEEYNILDDVRKRITDTGKIENIEKKFPNHNEKFKEELTEPQIKKLNEIMHDSLVRFEYA